MTLRIALTLLTTSVLSFCSGLPATAAEPINPRPHILIFVIDDLGYADVGFNGGREIQTPAIDALAAEGTVLAAHYVQPVCSPTRAALMTGRYATRTGVYTIVRPNARWGLPLDERTLADALRQAGYTTAITGKWHLGEFEAAYRPTARGFDHQYGHYFGAIDYYNHIRDGQVDWYRDDQPLSEDGYSTELIAAEASRLIAKHQPVADSKPLFLYVPFNGVHAPLQVPESYLQPYSALKGNRRTYAGMLAAVDAAIGRITAALREAGMLDNTLVLFTADNGGPSPGTVTSNGQLRAGKGTLYEGGVRGCAFIRWPGKIPAGTRSEEPIHAVDWFPTLVGIAGGSLEQPKPLDGKDLAPMLIEGKANPHASLLLVQSPQRAAIRAGDWKLLQSRGASAAVGKATKNGGSKAAKKKAKQADAAAPQAENGPELYNLREDPGEKNNLASAQPELVAQLSKQLDELLLNAVPPGNPVEP
ncbi:MAG: Arylsulfatase [Planctomycetota bacterium]|jgi:arylsulfatase A-like enzyme